MKIWSIHNESLFQIKFVFLGNPFLIQLEKSQFSMGHDNNIAVSAWFATSQS